MDAITTPGTCFINKRKREYFGFTMQKGFIYGNIGGVRYITNGNPAGGTMTIYTNNGNGWIKTLQRVKYNRIAQAVMNRYGRTLALKNKEYKGSEREQADKRTEQDKPCGLELLLRTGKPYDGKYKDSRQRVYITSRAERRMGV